MEPHIVALDLDGTVVDYDDELHETVREAVRRVAAQRHHVVIATGRAVSGALDIAYRLGLEDGYVVCSNGSVIIRLTDTCERGWEVVHVESFDPAPALERMSAVVPTGLFMVEDTELVRWGSAEFPEGDLAAGAQLRIVSFKELKKLKATRIVMRELDGTNEEFQKSVEKIGLHGVTYSVGWSNWLDIAPDGVSKASALEHVARSLNVPVENTVAVGDGSNDKEMIAWAGTGVAMGQARDELRNLADRVTGTVEDNGLAQVLDEIFPPQAAVSAR